jgi:hypothetical protein
MNDDADAPFDAALLDAYEPLVPPRGFADAVLAARRNQVARAARGWSRWRRPLLAATGMVALIMFAWWMVDRSGRIEPRAPTRVAARTTLHVGHRAVAVAESGSVLGWHAKGGDVLIDQMQGNVFYRVEHGHTEVATPIGHVAVRGTCFRVELGGRAGAIWPLGTADWMRVTVDEGEVALSANGGSLALSAGSAGWVWAGGTPRLVEPGEKVPVAADDLMGAYQARVASSVRAAAPADPGNGAARRRRGREDNDDGNWTTSSLPVREDDDHGSWIAPSREKLLAMAKRCALRWDIPPVSRDPSVISDARARDLELSSDERGSYNRVLGDLTVHVMTDLRALYVEVTGDFAGAATMAPQSMAQEVLDKSPKPLLRDAAWKLSHERAGLLPPPSAVTVAAASPVERLLRMIVSLGDTFEQELGQAIGAERAHALREAQDGWETRSITAPGCPESR